jgi:hypothetical protein
MSRSHASNQAKSGRPGHNEGNAYFSHYASLIFDEVVVLVADFDCQPLALNKQ